MSNKFHGYLQLIRLHAPTGYILLFLPCFFGLSIGITKAAQFWYAPLFFVGSFVMRSAGCVINDIFDRKIDAKVDRTKNRPLATGVLSIKEAMILLIILMLCGLAILLTLPAIAIVIGLCTVPLIVIYPLMKRITYFPQVLLGMTYGASGVLIAYATVASRVDLCAILVYVGCIFWTIGYDCIYAFMDTKDDKKIGVKSIAIFLEDKNYDNWIMIFYIIFASLMACGLSLSGINPFLVIIGSVGAFVILVWQVWTLDIQNRSNCMSRWKSNAYVGLIFGCVILIDKVFFTIGIPK